MPPLTFAPHTHTFPLNTSRSPIPLAIRVQLASTMARIHVWVLVLLLLLTPTTAARSLRGDQDDGSRLTVTVRRSMKSGDDAVPTAAKVADYQSKYNEWVHFQAEQLTADYPPAAANPSVPCCSP